jgi:hypothetical protein
MRTVGYAFGVFGFLFPVFMLVTDRLSPHGWWPGWVRYVWPTSYMLMANEALVNARTYTVTGISLLSNALLYALVGWALYRATRGIRSGKA